MALLKVIHVRPPIVNHTIAAAVRVNFSHLGKGPGAVLRKPDATTVYGRHAPAGAGAVLPCDAVGNGNGSDDGHGELLSCLQQ